MPESLRAGLVGLGWIAAEPASPASNEALGTATPYSHASAIEAHGGIDVVAVCDPNGQRQRAFEDVWGHKWPDIRLFANTDEMLAQSDLDLVCVATPDHLHADVVTRAVESHVPMILCEKPLTTSLAEADSLLELIRSSRSTVAVNHTWRWRLEVVEARSIVSSGELGPLSQIVIQFGGPRAMLFRNLSHFFDLATFFAGDTPVLVAGELEGGSNDYGLTYRGEGGNDPDLDPGANAYISYRNGVRAFVAGYKGMPQDFAIHLLCEGGAVVIDAIGNRVLEAPRTSDGTPATSTSPAVRYFSGRGTRSGMVAGLAELLSAHSLGREPSSSASTARWVVAIIDSVLRSHASGGRPIPVPARQEKADPGA